MEFSELVTKRYATKKFDGSTLPQDKIDALLEIIRMSASSFGLQPYKIKVITDNETKEKLFAASWNQEQITTCSHVLVFCANKNVKAQIETYDGFLKDAGMPDEARAGFVGVMKGFEEGLGDNRLAWTQRQVYLAVGNAINGARSLGFDSCPMEGFSEEEYAKILELPETLVPTCVVPVGIAADEQRPKIRFPKEDLFF